MHAGFYGREVFVEATGLIRDPAGRPSPSQGGCTDVLLSQMRIAVGTCATSTHTCSEVLRLLLRQVTTAKSPMSRLSPLLSAGTGLNGAHGAARPTARTGPHARRRARGRTPDGAHGAARPTARTGPHARRRARGPGGVPPTRAPGRAWRGLCCPCRSTGGASHRRP